MYNHAIISALSLADKFDIKLHYIGTANNEKAAAVHMYDLAEKYMKELGTTYCTAIPSPVCAEITQDTTESPNNKSESSDSGDSLDLPEEPTKEGANLTLNIEPLVTFVETPAPKLTVLDDSDYPLGSYVLRFDNGVNVFQAKEKVVPGYFYGSTVQNYLDFIGLFTLAELPPNEDKHSSGDDLTTLRNENSRLSDKLLAMRNRARVAENTLEMICRTEYKKSKNRAALRDTSAVVGADPNTEPLTSNSVPSSNYSSMAECFAELASFDITKLRKNGQNNPSDKEVTKRASAPYITYTITGM